MITFEKLFIGGRWVATTGTERIEVFDSLTETVMATIPAGTADDVATAVAAAKAAFPEWSTRKVSQRATYMTEIADALDARLDELAALISRQTGMAYSICQPVQVGGAVYAFRRAAQLAEAFPFEWTVGNSLVVREPIGVVGCITPWNYPLLQIAAKVAFAMAAGCTVVLKPSEIAPVDAFALAEIVDQVGLPGGVFNLVSGYGPVVGEAIAAHPDVDMISFTGSNRAGRRVSQLAAETIKKLALELGGKSPNILLDDLDDAGFDAAVTDGVGKAFANSGQSCDALTRMLVPRAAWPRRRMPRRQLSPHSWSVTHSAPVSTSVHSRRPPSATVCRPTSRRASTRARTSSLAASAPQMVSRSVTTCAQPCSRT